MLKNINHVWVFLTDRCNLGCGYCFYKYRNQQQVMSLELFERILDFVRPMAPMEFIFSGGEPLMEIQRLKEMIDVVRQQNLSRYISVQTNATLLDKMMMDFFLVGGVNLEVGIDGDDSTTQHNRPGISGVNFKDILRGVNLVLNARGPMTVTMVVHPHGVSQLFENVKYLANVGLRSLEVHPAFLENWNPESADIFIDQYRKACAWELKQGLQGLIGRGYSQPAQGTWDLLSVPDGRVLGNWLLLSFPEEVRKDLYLMDFSVGKSSPWLPEAPRYFQALKNFIDSHPQSSYRSISNFNASYAVQMPQGHKYEQRVRDYIHLCERIEAIDLKVMETLVWQR